MIGGSESLRNYVLSANGISRKRLNIMASIGLFIFGWLIKMAFDDLGEKATGWFYLIGIGLFGFVLSRETPALGLVGTGLYVIAWVHANAILSGHQRAARARVAEIDALEPLTVDAVLEQGLLRTKVLGESEAFYGAIARVRDTVGADPVLLTRAGHVLLARKESERAIEFFESALAGTPEADRKPIADALVAARKALPAPLNTARPILATGGAR